MQTGTAAMTWPDVRLWRKAARARLIGARVALPHFTQNVALIGLRWRL